MKRIVVELDEKLHREIKIFCFNKGISMKDYLMELINKDLETKKEQTH